MVERMTGSDRVSALRLSREFDVSPDALLRWVREASSVPLMPPRKPKSSKAWSVEEKIRVLGQAAILTGEELTVFLQREGLALADLEHWRLILAEGNSKATAKRIRILERDLARKEKALAEAAALIILKKRLEVLWEDEDDDTDDETEK